MTEPIRPDPDKLLAAITKNEAELKSGRLRIFFGMAAGVGKTYAMLKAARDRLTEGIDVVIGTVDTHGRPDTEALLAGLPTIPRKKLIYKETAFEEMDIDAVLARKPQLVLVDELAHTNVPGSRHLKRWHDVVELLDAGIDVYTTVNVQHLESRKEPVETITGIKIRETVPDSILERACQIILIDITPAELLKRLSEGKVYLGDMAQAAIQNFFKENRLTALRELALRFTAEKVDNELQGMMTDKPQEAVWKTGERLMVAVSHSPHSEGLIRATRRLAFGMEVPWLGVHVDTGITLSDEDKATLARNISLVHELGGQFVSTADVDVAQALKRTAHQYNVTQLIVGRPVRRRFRDMVRGGTILDQLVRESGDFDVHVLRQEKKVEGRGGRGFNFEFESALQKYAVVIATVLLIGILNGLLLPVIGYRAAGFIFLFAVLALGLFVSLGPSLVAAVMSALIWDFFFIPPYGTFRISAPEDFAMCAAYLVVAIITQTLTHRIRKSEKMLGLREERTRVLYDIVQVIAGSNSRSTYIYQVAEKMGTLLKGEITIIPVNENNLLEHQACPPCDWITSEKEWAVAQWSFDHHKPAGWSTDTLPTAIGLYIPLIGTSETVGILAFRPLSKARLLQEEENLLFTVARQLAVSMERELFQERSRRMQQLAESERLYQTILNSVSHELRTPLTAIIGNASALSNSRIASDPSSRQQMTEEIVKNAERLNRVVSNLLDMSRLNSGKLTLKRDWHEIGDLLSVVLDSQKTALSGHKVVMRIAENLPLVRVDFQLFQQALSNLLFNAATYTAPGTIVEIEAKAAGRSLRVSVSDNGPGVPEGSIPHLFEMFYRVPGSLSGGAGMGLAITKGIVEAHGGTVMVSNRLSAGACFTITLPIEQQPEMPRDKGGL